MRKRIALLIFTAVWASLAFAADPPATTPKSGQTNSVWVGVRPEPSVDGSKSSAAEYEPTDGAALFGLDYETRGKNGSLSLQLDSRGSEAQNHTLRFDIGPIVRSITNFHRLPHNLDHDTMVNLEAATKAGRQLWHTDASPGAEYGFRFSTLDHRTEVSLGSRLTVAAIYNQQKRTGHTQAYAISHCEGCHVQSQARPIDETTRTVGGEATLGFDIGTFTASFAQRDHSQDIPFVTNQYERAVHPELRTKIFDNRITYGLGEGPLPIDYRPDIDKETTRLDFAMPKVAGFALSGGGVWAQTENAYTGLTSDYAGYNLSAARILPAKWRLNWRGRVYTIDSDAIFIDVPDTIASAGPQAGKTYEQVYGFDPDWTRYSALDRDVIDSRLELARRLGKRAGNVRVSWTYNATDREHYEITDDGGTETTTNVLAVAWNNRIAKRLRVDARFSHGIVDNPLINLDATCSTFTSKDVASPLDPTAGQYWQMRDARVGDTTASPEGWDEIRVGASYTLGRGILSANGRWWNGSNDEGDLTDWSRERTSLAVNYAFSPNEQWSWFAGATMFDTSTESPVCIGLFDG